MRRSGPRCATPYEKLIREVLEKHGLAADAAGVEAWMRSERATLDGLSPEEFESAALAAVQCSLEAGPAMTALLAASFGLETQAEREARR